MKIILLKEINKLGKANEIINVKDGYARNYLIPKNLAIPATTANIHGLERNKQRFSKTIERQKKASMGLAELIDNTTVKITIKTGADGKSFGSITSQDMVELLHAENIEIDKKHIVHEDTIKQPGVYDIKVHLGESIDAVFKLVVLEEGE
jgi:large subunit ribosomal protein L9